MTVLSTMLFLYLLYRLTAIMIAQDCQRCNVQPLATGAYRKPNTSYRAVKSKYSSSSAEKRSTFCGCWKRLRSK